MNSKYVNCSLQSHKKNLGQLGVHIIICNNRLMKNFLKTKWVHVLYVFAFIAIYPISLFASYTFGQAVGEHKLQELIQGNIAHIYSSDVPDAISEKEQVDFDVFWEAWQLLDEKFVHSTATTTEVTLDQDKVWGAIRGLAASYEDPYTVFFPPEDKKLFDEDIQGEFSGVGIEIGIRNGLLTVISPLTGTPAFNAGIKAKDIIVEIDSEESASMSSTAAARLIRGEKGTPVVLTVVREGENEPLDITVIRDIIVVPTIESQVIEDVFVIELYTFNRPSAGLFQDELQKFVNSGLEKLIIDVRGNPGGFLQASVDISSWFIPEGELIVTENFENKREDRIHVSSGPGTFDGASRVILLTNGGSASASEILAGALRDYESALLVGENTFGKGSVQELVELTPETSLKLTIAKWILPLGEHISIEGIKPNLIISDDSETEIDEQLEKALELMRYEDFDSLFLQIPEELQVINDSDKI